MKKRKMKKYIPKNTIYCRDCRWWKFLGVNEMYLGDCKWRNEEGKCEDCGQTAESRCVSPIIRCEYLGITDRHSDTLLWDRCKECNEHYPKC